MVLAGFLALLTVSGYIGGLPEASGYSLASSSVSLSLRDARTNAAAISTLFVDEYAAVVVDGVVWEGDAQSGSVLLYKTFVDNKLQARGRITLPDDPLALPMSFDAGEISASRRGKTLIEVKLTVGDSKSEGSLDVQTIQAWMSSIPFIAAVLIALFHARKELSLLAGILLGSFMVEGSLAGGFVFAINRCLVDAIADTSHAYIYLFAFGMSGLVTMIRRSGGLHALKERISQSKRSSLSQRAQLAFWILGLFLFFDQYASSIIVGELLSSVLKAFPVSIEKLAFIVDATAAPVASIVPGSSWAGVLVPLIQTELDRIVAFAGTDDLSISTTGFTVLLKSMKYQFYSFFMILLVPMVVLAKRDVGPMLIAERTRYVKHMLDSSQSSSTLQKKGYERKEKYTNGKLSSFVFPVFVLNIFLWCSYGIYVPDTIDVENYPSYPLLALVASVAATAILTQFLYLWQKRNPNESPPVAGLTKVREDDRVSIIQRITTFRSQGETLDGGIDEKPTALSVAQEPVVMSPSKASVVENTTTAWDESEKNEYANTRAPNLSSNYGDLTEDGLEVKFSEENGTVVFNQRSTERGVLVPTENNAFGAYNDEVEVMKSMSLTSERIGTLSPKTMNDFDIEEQKEEVAQEGEEGMRGAVWKEENQEEGQEVEIEIEELSISDQSKSTKETVAVLTIQGTIESFGEGGSRILYVLILLTLAWAMRILFTEIGFDRVFAIFLTSDNVKPELLPSLVFGISLVISLIIRSGFGTVALLLPLVSIPAYEASLGNPELFYATIGALFSGAIAGEHISPISDSSLLTCLATKCELTNHILTQLPYALFACIVSLTAGTLAVSHSAYPVFVAYPIGIVMMICFIFIFCCPIIEPNGNFDMFTEFYRYCRMTPGLDMLKSLIVEVYRIEEEDMDEDEAGEALARVLATHETYELATSSEESGYSSVDSNDESTFLFPKQAPSRRNRRTMARRSRRARQVATMESRSYSEESSASGDFMSGSASSEGEESKAEKEPSRMRTMSSFSFLRSQETNPESKGESYETSFDETEGGDTRTTYENTQAPRTYDKSRQKALETAPADTDAADPDSPSNPAVVPPAVVVEKRDVEDDGDLQADASLLEQSTFLMSATFPENQPQKTCPPLEATKGGHTSQAFGAKIGSSPGGENNIAKKQAALERPPLAPAPAPAQSKPDLPSAPQRVASSTASLKQAPTSASRRTATSRASARSRASSASRVSATSRGEDSSCGSTYGGESEEMSEAEETGIWLSGTMDSSTFDENDDKSYDTYGTRPEKIQSKFKSKTNLTTKRCDRFYF